MARRRGFIRREIAAHRPALVFASSSNMAFVTARARQPAHNGPSWCSSSPFRSPRRPIEGAFRRFYRRNLFGWIFKRYDLALTLTDAERDWLIAQYPELKGRFRTVPNAYITDSMLAPSPPRASGPPRLVTAGRMVKQKRHDVLLRALAMSARKDVRLTILGDGPWRGQLEELVKTLGLADRVDMPGYTADVLPELRRSDLFVLSSDYEGLACCRAGGARLQPARRDHRQFPRRSRNAGSQPSCAVVAIQDPARTGRSDRPLPRPHDRTA